MAQSTPVHFHSVSLTGHSSFAPATGSPHRPDVERKSHESSPRPARSERVEQPRSTGFTPTRSLGSSVASGVGDDLRQKLQMRVVCRPSDLNSSDQNLRMIKLESKHSMRSTTPEEVIQQGLLLRSYREAAETVPGQQTFFKSAELAGRADTLRKYSVRHAGPLSIASRRAAAVLKNRSNYLLAASTSNPFHTTRLLHSKAAYWTTAAKVLADEKTRLGPGPCSPAASATIRQLDYGILLFKGRADYFEAISNHTPFMGDPEEILGNKTGSVTEAHVNAVIHQAAAPPGPPPNERALAVACLAERLHVARQAYLKQAGVDASTASDAEAEKRFSAAWNQFLNQRDNPTIHSTVVVPARAGVSDDLPESLQVPLGQMVFHCTQTPARSLTASLRKRYTSDGIQGVNCHDRAQYKHANNLYRSELTDHEGQRMLSLIRHGVLSASAYTRTGISQMSDSELGKAALGAFDYLRDDELREEIGRLRSKNAEVGAFVRRQADVRCLPKFLRCCGTSSTLEDIRRAVNLKRAEEAVQAALSTLPAPRVQAIHAAQGRGETPSVTLCSVSLMTPDAFRGCSPKGNAHTRDERRMWRDQLSAFQAICSQPRSLEIPRLDEQAQLMRDAEGLPLTQAVRLQVHVLAMNFPVNRWGTGKVSLVMGADASRAANLGALAHLLGDDFRQEETGILRRMNPCGAPWVLGGLVAQACDALGEADGHAKVLKQLARQVGDLYLSGDYRIARGDPYKMAARVVVLGELLGLPVLMNCKSGKDRTTEAEAHARLLRIQIASHGVVPPYNTPLDPLQRTQLWDLHTSGGSREIQWWNTNMAGTKLKHKELHSERYGIQGKGDHRAQYLGMSGRVKS